MGLFNYIKNFEGTCPKCGEKINDFQSKDWNCTMEDIPYWYVRNFYTSCPKCKTWVEYRLKGSYGKPPYKPPEDYELYKPEEDIEN